MKLPRNIRGSELVKGLARVGYVQARQKGDHVYLTTRDGGEHHVCVPLHNPVKTGTLSNILQAVARHLKISRDELLERMKL